MFLGYFVVLSVTVSRRDRIELFFNVYIVQSSRRPTGFFQCFDTVDLVIWPVKIVSEMTYKGPFKNVTPEEGMRSDGV